MKSSSEKHLLNHSTNYVLVIHGGAGTMHREGSTPEQKARYHAGLEDALNAGYEVLKAGGESMDAAVAAVSSMEDNPIFNSGKGAVFNTDGKNELEASIMLSKPPASHPEIPTSRRGMGLTLLSHIRNPSQLVRALYLSPSIAPHTFLSAPHAESLAVTLGESIVDPSYFFTDARWHEHRSGLGLPDEPYPLDVLHTDIDLRGLDLMPKGTVGAVALDVRGCITAVTSTGGRTNKLPGRIGDTPLMAAGFWAEQWTSTGWVQKVWDRIRNRRSRGVGVSGTGDGDYFIRQATASTLAHRVKYLNESLKDAADFVVKELRSDGGDGGVIALDLNGNIAMPLNCPGMYRGFIRSDGVPHTAIFNDDPIEV